MNKPIDNLTAASNNKTRKIIESVFSAAIRLVHNLDHFADRYTEYLSNKRAIRTLETLNSEMLKDIGIDKNDVVRIAMSNNPSGELQRLNKEKSRIYKKKAGIRSADSLPLETP